MKAIVKNLVALVLLFIGVVYSKGFAFSVVVACAYGLFVSARRDLKEHRRSSPTNWRDT